MEEKNFWTPLVASLSKPHPTQGTYRGASGPLWSWQTRLSSFALRGKKKDGSILRLFLFLAAWASWCYIDTSQSLPPDTGVHFRAESMPITLYAGLLCPGFPGTVLVTQVHPYGSESWRPFAFSELFWSG